MDSMRDRAKDMFPVVLLTLLSIVQALALEFLWDHTRNRAELFEFSVAVEQSLEFSRASHERSELVS